MNHFTRNAIGAEIYANASKIPNTVSVTSLRKSPENQTNNETNKQMNRETGRQTNMSDKNIIVIETSDYNYKL